MASVLIRDGREEERSGEAGGRDWGNVSTRIVGCTRSQEKGEEIFSLGAPRRPILPTLWFQTSYLQNRRRINFQGCKPPSLGDLLGKSWAPSKTLHVTHDFLLSSIFFFKKKFFFGIFQQDSRTKISELPPFKISAISLHKTSFRSLEKRLLSHHTHQLPITDVNMRLVLCTETFLLLFAHTKQMVQSWNKNEPSFGPSPDSRLYEHMVYKPLYIFYMNSHLLCFYFILQDWKFPSKDAMVWVQLMFFSLLKCKFILLYNEW